MNGPAWKNSHILEFEEHDWLILDLLVWSSSSVMNIIINYYKIIVQDESWILLFM